MCLFSFVVTKFGLPFIFVFDTIHVLTRWMFGHKIRTRLTSLMGTHCWAVKESKLKVWSSKTARDGTIYSLTLKTSHVRHKPPRFGGLSIREATRIKPPRLWHDSTCGEKYFFLHTFNHKAVIYDLVCPLGYL